MNRVSLQDCINPINTSKSEYVIVDSDMNKGVFSSSMYSKYFEHQLSTFYKCKRIVAENLHMMIMAEYPLIMK